MFFVSEGIYNVQF